MSTGPATYRSAPRRSRNGLGRDRSTIDWLAEDNDDLNVEHHVALRRWRYGADYKMGDGAPTTTSAELAVMSAPSRICQLERITDAGRHCHRVEPAGNDRVRPGEAGREVADLDGSKTRIARFPAEAKQTQPPRRVASGVTLGRHREWPGGMSDGIGYKDSDGLRLGFLAAGRRYAIVRTSANRHRSAERGDSAA